jgi:NAD(P)-dependent dehydrogenase (short-subunit alcohol dehydrogenase family)
MHRTNIRGTFVVNQQAARRARRGGAVVNFSSAVIGRILPNYTGYAASKAAVEAMTFILAHELRGRDVTVNAVAPGPTATDMFLEGKDEAALARPDESGCRCGCNVSAERVVAPARGAASCWGADRAADRSKTPQTTHATRPVRLR